MIGIHVAGDNAVIRWGPAFQNGERVLDFRPIADVEDRDPVDFDP